MYKICLTSKDLTYLHGAIPQFWCDFQFVCLYRELKNEGLADFSLLLYASLGVEPRP